MPLPLGPEESRRFLETGQAPAPHLDMLHAAAFRAAGVALQLGVFDAIADQPVPTHTLAQQLGVDPRGLGLLLATLQRFGYVTAVPEGYGCTPAADAWLRSGPQSYATVFAFWQRVLFEFWDDLESSLRDGRPATDFYAWLAERPEALHAFQTMLARLARALAPEVVTMAPLPDGTRELLDVGGGHATYTAALCREYPQLRATVLDVPEALAVGQEAVTDAGLTDRVTLTEGDLHTTAYEQAFDVALLFNIVHGLPPEDVRRLLSRVAAALRPGGQLLVLEPLGDHATGGGVAGEAFVRMFSLNLFHGQGGQVYDYADLAAWLAEAGFDAVERHAFRSSPTDHLLVATRAR